MVFATTELLCNLPSRCFAAANFDSHPVMDLQGMADEYTLAAECPGTTRFSVNGVATATLSQTSPIHIWGFSQSRLAYLMSVNTDYRSLLAIDQNSAIIWW